MLGGALLLAFVGTLLVVGSTMVIVEPGQVGVRHAFATVDPLVAAQNPKKR